MILVIGHALATPETRDEMLRLAVEHVLRSRAEPGCISHEVSVDAQQPMRLTFVERWADMAALQVHFRVDASRSFGKAMARLGGAAPEIHVYRSDEIDLRAQPA